MVHSNIHSSGVNLKKGRRRSGPRTDTLCAARCTPSTAFKAGRVAPSQSTISSVDDLVVGFYDFLFSGFTLGIVCVGLGAVIGAVIGLLLRTFVDFGRV